MSRDVFASSPWPCITSSVGHSWPQWRWPQTTFPSLTVYIPCPVRFHGGQMGTPSKYKLPSPPEPSLTPRRIMNFTKKFFNTTCDCTSVIIGASSIVCQCALRFQYYGWLECPQSRQSNAAEQPQRGWSLTVVPRTRSHFTHVVSSSRLTSFSAIFRYQSFQHSSTTAVFKTKNNFSTNPCRQHSLLVAADSNTVVRVVNVKQGAHLTKPDWSKSQTHSTPN